MLDYTPLEAGVLEMIPALAKDYTLAICTNRGESVDLYLEHYKIKDCFSYVITAMDVPNPKPSPDGVLKILDYFDAEPEKTLFIGDSEADYYAATAAGTRFLAFGASLFGSPFITDHRDILEYL
jgi:HAD superfamily hydrolase (TIGR01509 family)